MLRQVGVGINNSVAEIIVQFRPPNTRTAKVSGGRRHAPGHGDKPQSLGGGDRESGRRGAAIGACGHLDDDDAPEHPHRKADVLGGNDVLIVCAQSACNAGNTAVTISIPN
jgi:hypothetical protein